jgi:DNA topoisomerase-2
VKNYTELVKKKNKEIHAIKAQFVKDNIFVFLKCTISNPTFDSQSKETLTTPVSKFGSKCELSKSFYNKLYNSPLTEKIVELCQKQMDKSIKKQDGKKQSVIRGIPKLDDANWAGTSKSEECTLILTEGDSAKTMAIAGLSVVGRDRYGVFPLRGKILNVLDVAEKKIAENSEITDLKKIMGLENKKDYKDTKSLRYGRIMSMTDSDVDGTHIKGLLFNLFNTMWPSLLKVPGFMTSMLTPVVKAKKGATTIEFYNLTDYDNWKETTKEENGWNVKYYKGLGTSTDKEAKEYFQTLKVVEYNIDSETCCERLDLAFNRKRADDRKTWLYAYDKNRMLNPDKETVSYTQFVDDDLIHFSNYNLERSIPNIMDGLKRSTRKILYSCFKRNLTKEIRVAQLAGYVSEHASYHHGETSLQEAIIGMAQDYVGSNNINYLMPNGQFGSRQLNGKDAASSRYIHTELNPITSFIFLKSDTGILNHLYDDNYQVEPDFYLPIIPTILVNGCIGIGTGFSVNIPNYNPLDLIKCVRALLAADVPDMCSLPEISPWYRGFTGIIQKDGDSSYMSIGRYTRTTSNTVDITELPVSISIQDYKEFLEVYLEKNENILKNFCSHSTEALVNFTLTFQDGALNKLMTVDTKTGLTKFHKEFKLTSNRNLSTRNMHVYDEEGHIIKCNSIHEIIKRFFKSRLKFYETRKKWLVQTLETELVIIQARIEFITRIIDKRLVVYQKKKQELIDYLIENNFPMVSQSYNYLVNMPIYSLSLDKKQELDETMNAKHLELMTVQGNTIQNMWRTDLDALDDKLSKVWCKN